MKTMPETAKHYKSTPEFTELTVPPALRRDHTTGEGVWAKIQVLEGMLTYCITEPDEERHDLRPGSEGIIEPRMKHYVDISGPVKFRVDFYR